MNSIKHSEENPMSRVNCSDNFVQVYDGSTSSIDRKYYFCTADSNKLYKSKTNRVFIRYLLHKTSNEDYVKFKLTYNPYKIGQYCFRFCL